MEIQFHQIRYIFSSILLFCKVLSLEREIFDYYKIISIIGMYRQNYARNDAPAQSIQFSSLRKATNAVQAKTQGQGLTLSTQPNVALLLLSGFSLIEGRISVSDTEFNDFVFQQVPKNFQQFQHQKTMNELFNVIRTRIKNTENLCDFLNFYPITAFVLQCWVRQRAKNWIQNNLTSQAMGNENEILNDLSVQIRGPLLGMITNCFGLSLSIKYDISSKIYFDLDPSELQQSYGDSHKSQLIIQYRSDGFSNGKLVERQTQLSLSQPISKTSECGYLRRSKVIDSQIESRSGAEYKSVKKERGGPCQKCGPGKKCQCNTIKRKGLGVTPKSNQLSNSSSLGFKNDPFNLGFLNANNLSKIRDAGKQK